MPPRVANRDARHGRRLKTSRPAKWRQDGEKTMTRLLGRFAAIAAASWLFALPVPAMAQTMTLKLGHVLPGGDHPYQQGAMKFAELVQARTNGRIKVDVFPSGQLGGERDMVEGLKIGTIDLVITASPVAGAVANDRKVFLLDIPYVFKDYEALTRVLEGDVGAEMTRNWPKSGFRSVGYFIAGFHQIANSKRPIVKPEDMKGLKIRAIQSKSSILMIEALGPTAVPMAFPEVYTGIQQGVVDGFANSMTTLFTAKYYEVAPYISVTNHLVGMLNLVMSESVYQGLSAADRKIIDEVGIDAARFQRNLYKDGDQRSLALLKEKAKVNTNVDIAAFQRQVETFVPKFVELVNEPGAKELADRLIQEGRK
jgi:tripartite ATP-independent transporter DctP family solute receptor